MLPPVKKLVPALALLLFIFPTGLCARSPVSGEDLTVSLMVVGPGIPLYVWWGHIGLIVEDQEENWSYFYDFGNFSFEEENFYRNFAMGRLYYLKVKSRTEPYLRFLSWFDRTVTIYELNLTGEEKKSIYDNLQEGVKPENCTYLYHHYEDNCSTRIRDALDTAMGGEIREQSGEYAQSFRAQSNRFVRPFWAYLLLNYLQGPDVDRPVTGWDALFLPQELEKKVRSFIRRDGTPLVSKIIVQQDGAHPYIPDIPFPRAGDAFLRGMMLFFLTLFLRTGSGRGRKGSSLWRIVTPLMVALPGLFLCFMMFFTDHDVTENNLNALITCPVLLGALIPAIRYNRRLSAPKTYERFWDFQSFLVLLSLLFKLLPGVTQDNGAVIMLFLPLFLAQGTPGTYMARLFTIDIRIFPWSRKLAS